MPFEIHVTRSFSAAHALRLYDGSLEPLHGHNWQVRVTVGSKKLDSIGVVMDFHVLERLLEEIIGPFHNRNLNDLSPFATINPSAENVALHIAHTMRLPDVLNGDVKVALKSVEVWETPDCCAVYRAAEID